MGKGSKMPIFDWFDHYKGRFGLKWFFAETIYRLADLNILADFETILGVGSGRAFLENLLSKNRFIVVSDINPALMHLAKEHRKNMKGFMVCDGFSLPFKRQSFDCVYSQGLMEHFEETQATSILNEMGRVGQNVVFSVPLHSYGGKTLGIEYHRKPEEWHRILSNIFQFRKTVFYPNKKEAVFIASNKPLSLSSGFKTIVALKKIIFWFLD